MKIKASIAFLSGVKYTRKISLDRLKV